MSKCVATFETGNENKKVHQQKSMHEKRTPLFVVTQILSHSDKRVKIEHAFLPRIMIKIHTYPMCDMENLCHEYSVPHVYAAVTDLKVLA